MQSKAPTVTEYLRELPEERRRSIQAVRRTIQENLPQGYTEVMQYGIITYVVPLTLYPEGYLNKKDTPLPYVSLASQKNHMALYLMHIYGDRKSEVWFQKEYERSGKKLDMGKSCVRFKKIDDLPLDVIGKAVARMPVNAFVKMYEQSRQK